MIADVIDIVGIVIFTIGGLIAIVDMFLHH